MADDNHHDHENCIEIDCLEVHQVAAAALDQHRLAAHEVAIFPALGLPITCRCGRVGSINEIQEHALHEAVHAVLDLFEIKTDLGRHDSQAGAPVKEGWVDERHRH